MNTSESNPADRRSDQASGSAPAAIHFNHHLYFDKWKQRALHITAPIVITKAELERIQGWLSTIFIIEEVPNSWQPND